jgi:hypothetical protein
MDTVKEHQVAIMVLAARLPQNANILEIGNPPGGSIGGTDLQTARAFTVQSASLEDRERFANETFDLITIHTEKPYQDSVGDVEAWLPRVKLGGQIAVSHPLHSMFWTRENKERQLPDGFFGPEQVDLYRRLVKRVPEGGTVVEVGVWLGRSLCGLAEVIKERKLKVIAVDTFEGTPNEADPVLMEVAKKIDVEQAFRHHLEVFGITEFVTVVKAPSLVAAAGIADGSVDFIFLDAEHTYDAVKADITAWKPKLTEKGQIGGHDFSDSFPGVPQAVKEVLGEDHRVVHECWFSFKRPPNLPRPDIKVKSQPVIAAEICTKDRYDSTLPLAMMSVIMQTRQVDKFVIYDDGEQKDLRELPHYRHILQLMLDKGIEWAVNFGQRKGQVANHQHMLDTCACDYIWRVDDDNVAEPDTLDLLLENMQDGVGAVGGLVWTPGNPPVDVAACSGDISQIVQAQNLQWSQFDGVREVDHLHNTFLFRKDAAKMGYCRELSPVGHREESIFTYEIKRAGFKVLIDPRAVTWHLRSPTGGIRSYNDNAMYDRDEAVFQRYMQQWLIAPAEPKLFVLDNGMGDHFAFKTVLPEIKEKYKDSPITLAVCYPDVFADDPDVKIISIEAAKQMVGNIERHDLYKFCWDNDWKGSLVSAYRRMYL